jgi:hypothetical protein
MNLPWDDFGYVGGTCKKKPTPSWSARCWYNQHKFMVRSDDRQFRVSAVLVSNSSSDGADRPVTPAIVWCEVLVPENENHQMLLRRVNKSRTVVLLAKIEPSQFGLWARFLHWNWRWLPLLTNMRGVRPPLYDLGKMSGRMPYFDDLAPLRRVVAGRNEMWRSSDWPGWYLAAVKCLCRFFRCRF